MRSGTTALLKTLPECLDEEAPLALRLLDVDERPIGLPRLPVSDSGVPYRRLLVLVRRGGRPLGWMTLPVDKDGRAFLDLLLKAVDLAPEDARDPAADPSTKTLLSVIVTTCADAESVIRCVDGILGCNDGNVEIVVVENRPALSTVERMLEERYGAEERVRYVEEHRRGLARARNAGLDAARGELVSFTDDDILVDREWIGALRGVFERSPGVDCVTGLILPFELETPTQVLVERFAGFGKGFVARTYCLSDPPLDQPLFPYTAGYFGSGANMTFRTRALRRLGGFDRALGAGTRARGGEDLDICIRLLHAGGRLAYEPAAIVWHRHPNTGARLRQQVFGYGVGLGAMLSKQIMTGPDRWSIVSRTPQGVRYFRHPGSRKNAARGTTFPRSLSRLERAGMAYGPLAYMASRLGRTP
jgi:GT2 family glycosyltransferase